MTCPLCQALCAECSFCFKRRVSMRIQQERTKTLPFPTDLLGLVQEYLLSR
jgi:hypothetical protein